MSPIPQPTQPGGLMHERPPVTQGPPVVANEPIQSGPNLNDPIQLAAAAESVAGGLEREAMAFDGRTGATGHPRPAFFYGYAADVMRRMIAHMPKPAPVAPTGDSDGGSAEDDKNPPAKGNDPPTGATGGKKGK